jgi:hypothetical protein
MNLLPRKRLLASNGRGWQIHELIDGSLHLSLGEPGLVFTRDEFALLSAMLLTVESKSHEPGTELVCIGPGRSIAYCADEDRLVLAFDELLITMRPTDAGMLVAMCRQALRSLHWSGHPADIRDWPQCERWN